LINEEKTERSEKNVQSPEPAEGNEVKIKEEEEDELEGNDEEETHPDPENDNSDSDDNTVAKQLIPAGNTPAGRILRDRTLAVKPLKYSYFTNNPKTFKKAVSGENCAEWKQAINNKLDNIKSHDVWLDCPSVPHKFLRSTWVFKTKPATALSPKKQKARLCIQGFLQTFGEDFL
jgi:hypothetical protein